MKFITLNNTHHAQITAKFTFFFLLEVHHIQEIWSGFRHFDDFYFQRKLKKMETCARKYQTEYLCVALCLLKKCVVSIQVSNFDCVASTVFSAVHSNQNDFVESMFNQSMWLHEIEMCYARHFGWKSSDTVRSTQL